MKTRNRFAVTLSTKGVAGALLLSVLMLGLATHAAAQDGKTALTPDEAKAKQAYAIGVDVFLKCCWLKRTVCNGSSRRP